MSLVIELPDDVRTRLTAEADRAGLPLSGYAAQLLANVHPTAATGKLVRNFSPTGVPKG